MGWDGKKKGREGGGKGFAWDSVSGVGFLACGSWWSFLEEGERGKRIGKDRYLGNMEHSKAFISFYRYLPDCTFLPPFQGSRVNYMATCTS